MVSQKKSRIAQRIFGASRALSRGPRRVVVGGLLVSAGAGCSSPALQKAEINAVLTVEDTKLDYTQYKTFKVSSKTVELCGVRLESGKLPASGIGGEGGRSGLDEGYCFTKLFHEADDELASAIEKEMTSRGFAVAPSGEKPDLFISTGVVSRTSWAYAPDYVWCEPALAYQCWYPKKTQPYSFGAGTILINMFSTGASKLDDLSSVWFASLSGVYVEDESQMANNASASVKTAFSQSKKFPKVSQ